MSPIMLEMLPIGIVALPLSFRGSQRLVLTSGAGLRSTRCRGSTTSEETSKASGTSACCVSFSGECAQFGLVWRDQFRSRFEPSAGEIERDLLHLKVRSRRSDCWPGTQLSDSKAVLQIYRCAGDAEAVLARPGSLFSWLQPRYPEDLCFFDATGAVVFASVSHEKDAWIPSRRLASQIGQIVKLKLERFDDVLIGCDVSYGSVESL